MYGTDVGVSVMTYVRFIGELCLIALCAICLAVEPDSLVLDRSLNAMIGARSGSSVTPFPQTLCRDKVFVDLLLATEL